MGFIPRPVTSGGRPAPLPTMAPWGLRRLRCCKASTPHLPATLPCSTFTARISLRAQVCMAHFCPSPLLPLPLVFFSLLFGFAMFFFKYILFSHMLYLQDTLKSFKTWTPAFERFPSEMHCMLSFTSCIHLGMFISPFEESLILRAIDPFFVVVVFCTKHACRDRKHAKMDDSITFFSPIFIISRHTSASSKGAWYAAFKNLNESRLSDILYIRRCWVV